jgi:GntR family transcriptional repressor for pyruvate dehydrogenase complex
MTDTARPAKLADTVAARLEQLILEGSLRPDEKLLPERELSQKLEVSRPTLRDALKMLERKGLVYSVRGSGTHVAPLLGEDISTPLATAVKGHPEAATDYLEFRGMVEGSAAYLAALRGTDLDRDQVHAAFAAMEKAHGQEDPSEEADADVDFHMAIYESCHNLVMLHIMRLLSEMLRGETFFNRNRLYQRKGVRQLLLDQHRAIHDAVIAGDAEVARTAAQAHINFTRDALLEISKADARLEVSLRRMAGNDIVAAGRK